MSCGSCSHADVCKASSAIGASVSNTLPLIVAWRHESSHVFYFVWTVRPLADGRASLPRIDQENRSLESALMAEGQFRADFQAALSSTSKPARLCVLARAPSGALEVLLSRDSEIRHGPFAEAARALGAGDDRRIVQLAVQYLSTDGVADDVAAAPVDEALLNEMKAHLKLNNDGPD